MTSSPSILGALEVWRQIRSEFSDYLEAQYAQAEHDTNGVLLNARGKAQGIDAFSLFYGNRVRVTAYASDELLDWFAEHGRTTFAEYEAARTPMPGHHWGHAPEEER